MAILKGHTKKVTSVIYHPDEVCMVMVLHSGQNMVWTNRTGMSLYKCEHEGFCGTQMLL